MKQKKCFWAVAATMLLTAASFTSCSNQDNIIAPLVRMPQRIQEMPLSNGMRRLRRTIA